MQVYLIEADQVDTVENNEEDEEYRKFFELAR
jgi:hypothetical protein